MEIIAESKNVKISPRKVKLVVDSIKRLNLQEALYELDLINKRASIPLKKAIKSAIANAINNLKLKEDELKIKEILVNEGIRYKRFHYAGRGRIRPYKKRTSHIKVILEEKIGNQNEKPKIKINKKKEEKHLASSV